MPNRATPDLIVVNADIRTMNVLAPRAEALAVSGGRLTAIGSTEAIRALAGKRTRVIDAGGRLVLPGFQDTHIHLQDSGTDRALSANLEGAATVVEFQDRLAEFGKANPRNAWVNGVGWYSGIFGEHNLDRHMLDAAVPDRPVFAYASDGHSACLNTKACAALGLTRDTPAPENGYFVKDAQGEPTGMLYEHAIFWAKERMPPLTDTDFAKGVKFGQALCNRHGITGVLDALVQERHMRVYQALDRAGELTVRVAATGLVTPDDSVASALDRLTMLRRDYASPMVRMHSAKFFFDGVFENRTAAMLAPYSDAKGGNAPVMFGENHVRELFIAVDAARFQIHVHVIGDKAARAALDGIQAAREVNGAWPAWHQLAHVQVLDPADIPRFHELGTVANIQPLWARHEPSVDDVALPMVGPERGQWMYAFRSMIDAGAEFAVSSDWGVSTLNPFAIMHTAVTRQPQTRRGVDQPVFLPAERMTVEEVVKGYTLNAARTAWREADTGSLERGKYADLIILDRDVFAISPDELGETSVLLTLLGGREVHRDKGFAG
ncbi:MAG: amidohydrolase [Hyphomicrobiaceae bacterium]